jgi:hypothetical protein
MTAMSFAPMGIYQNSDVARAPEYYQDAPVGLCAIAIFCNLWPWQKVHSSLRQPPTTSICHDVHG